MTTKPEAPDIVEQAIAEFEASDTFNDQLTDALLCAFNESTLPDELTKALRAWYCNTPTYADHIDMWAKDIADAIEQEAYEQEAYENRMRD